jgi:hypothetical protein
VEDESNIAQAEYTPISFPISLDDHLFPLSSQQKTRKRKRKTQTDSHPAHKSATRSRSSFDPPSHLEAVRTVPAGAEAGRTVLVVEAVRTAAEVGRTAAGEAVRIDPEEDHRVLEAVHTALVEAARIVLVGAGRNLQERE